MTVLPVDMPKKYRKPRAVIFPAPAQCNWFNKFFYSSMDVIPETVGQFTGLTDKHGKKIFEGDICDFCILGNDHVFVKITIQYGCVGFEPLNYEEVHPDDRKWECFWKNDEEEMWSTDFFTVIGNIHDNPELTEVAR